MSSVVVIGGGVIGATVALEFAGAGWQVTILEPEIGPQGCSHGNAGLVVPSHVTPLAAPGALRNGLAWALDPGSPFRLRPRLDGGLWRWTAPFLRSATRRHVIRSAPALRDIGLLSRRMWSEWARDLPFPFGFEERGLVMLAASRTGFREERESARVAERLGLASLPLGPAEVQDLEPDVRVCAVGGVYYPGDAHLEAGAFMRGLWGHLDRLGVTTLPLRATGFGRSRRRVTSIRAGSDVVTADLFVVATGAWSRGVLRHAGVDLLLEGGKGYSFTVSAAALPTRTPALLVERRAALTPLGPSVRLSGTLELAGTDLRVSPRRVASIARAPAEYYDVPAVEPPPRERVWVGLRPCSPDGLPYIGRVPGLENALVATGHGTMGLTLAPATASLIRGLALGEPLPIDPAPFRLDRWSRDATRPTPAP